MNDAQSAPVKYDSVNGAWTTTRVCKAIGPRRRAHDVCQQLLLARLGNFSHLPKGLWSLGYCRLAFLTLSSSHFDPSPTSWAPPYCNAHTPSRAKPLAPPRAIRVTERYGT